MAKAKPCCLSGKWSKDSKIYIIEFYHLASAPVFGQAAKDCISGENFLRLVDFMLRDFDPNQTAAAPQPAPCAL